MKIDFKCKKLIQYNPYMMTTKQSKKTKMKTTDPRDLDPKLVTAQHPNQVLKILDTYGIAVIPLPCDKKELDNALKDPMFYNTANAIFKDEHKVDEPSMAEKQNPATYKKRKAGDDAQANATSIWHPCSPFNTE